MRDYPPRVYLSASWDGTHQPLTHHIAEHFCVRGLTVIGDHPEYKKEDPFDRPWPQRVDGIVSDCGGLIAVCPYKRTPQTTTPFMFPEFVSAARNGLPVVVFAQTGVHVKVETGGGRRVLHFGDSPSPRELDPAALRAATDRDEIDRLLESSDSIDLTSVPNLQGPIFIPSDHDVSSVASVFEGKYVKKRRPSRYVFNVLPFSMRKREHVEIAKAVFEETGLPCHTALDHLDPSQRGMREHWKSIIKGSEFCIAEFSLVRDACLFEAGVFFGLEKDLFVVVRNEIPNLPFGLDNADTLSYGSLAELKRNVREVCCAKHKRIVYNLTIDKRAPDGSIAHIGGVPEWYYDSSGADIVRHLKVTGWSVSLGLGFFIWACFVFLGYRESPVAFTGVLVSFVFGAVSQSREITQTLEKRVKGQSRTLVWAAIAFLLLSVACLVFSYTRVPGGSRDGATSPAREIHRTP